MNDIEQKITRLQSFLDIPDKHDNKDEINRPALESEDDQNDETLSISDYLGL